MKTKLRLLLLLTSFIIVSCVHGQIISPGTTICIGTSMTLSDTHSAGTWSSANTAVATIGSSSGIITGITTGKTLIEYKAGLLIDTLTFTVDTAPFPLLGPSAICLGYQQVFIDSPGNTWSTSNTAIARYDSSYTGPFSAALVSGVSVGTATISFTTTKGCIVTKTITVAPPPAMITGGDSVCVGGTLMLSDATPGGTWSSGNDSLFTVDSLSGLVTGIVNGSSAIYYQMNTTGCFIDIYFTVLEKPVTSIFSMGDTICIGNASIIFISSMDEIDAATWTSDNPSIATIDTNGVAMGISPGTVIITLSATNICGTSDTTATFQVVDCYASVASVANNNITEIELTPNPNHGAFTLNLSSGTNEPVHVVITNVMGEKVNDFITATNKLTEINIKQHAGMYLLQAATAHGSYYAKLVIE